MILVDSSVWIDFFRGTRSAQSNALNELLATTLIVVGDLIMIEVLQGVQNEREFRQVQKTLNSFEQIDIAGRELSIKAAKNFRRLRALGYTVRKTVDTLIATRCIENNYALLHADRDFDAFEKHLGLQVAR